MRAWISRKSASSSAGPGAAANWLALATYAGRLAPRGPAVLLDVGSTTTDVIPLQDGTPVPRGRTDPERLESKELVYTGVRRTPLVKPRFYVQHAVTPHPAGLVSQAQMVAEDPAQSGEEEKLSFIHS